MFPDPDFLYDSGILAIRPYIRAKLHIFNCACAKRRYFYFRSKIRYHHRVRRSRFPTRRENFGDRPAWTFKADTECFIFAWIFRTSGSKMGILGENRGRAGAILTPTNTFLFLGVYTSVSNLVKIDKEMRPWEWAHTERHTDRQTDRQTQTDFIICPIAICYSYGTDNNVTACKLA